VRIVFTLIAAGLWIALAALPSRAVEQTVEPLDPGVEQRIQIIGGGTETEQVRMVETQAVETVEPHVPPSPAAKAASTAGKVVLGVTGAAIALGAMAASLLFF
jgi:hypothetical protein